MRCLDEATATALEGEATIPISSAWTFCLLVSACVEVRDYRRAFEWCDRIAEFAERYGSGYMRGFCRAHYGAVHLWRGRWHDAEAELDAAVRDFSRSRPAYVADALAWLAELRRRQGRAEEAERLLEAAGDWSRPRLCRGWLALDRGDAARAAELAERCLRQSGGERRLDGVPALELLAHARIARGELDEAAAAVDALRAVELLAGTAAAARRAPTWRRVPWRRPAAATSARDRCWRTRSTRSSAAAPRSRRHGRGSGWRRASSRSTAAIWPSRSCARRSRACASSARTSRRSARWRCSTRPGAGRRA